MSGTVALGTEVTIVPTEDWQRTFGARSARMGSLSASSADAVSAPRAEDCVPSELVVFYLSGGGVRRGRGASGVPSFHGFELFVRLRHLACGITTQSASQFGTGA